MAYHNISYHTISYHAIRYYTIQYYATLHCTVPYYTMLSRWPGGCRLYSAGSAHAALDGWRRKSKRDSDGNGRVPARA